MNVFRQKNWVWAESLIGWYTDQAIAEVTGFGRTTIRRRRNRLGIQRVENCDDTALRNLVLMLRWGRGGVNTRLRRAA